MTRRRRLALTLILVVAVAVGFVYATLPPRAVALPALKVAGAPIVVRGAYHVHTRRSDGTGTQESIAEAAARAGLAFVIFTDHGDGTRAPRPPFSHAGVVCIDGVEISTTGGHYVALGMRPAPYPLGGEARDVVEDVRRLGGFGVAAHPGSLKPELRWREWGSGFDGVEWLNADSEWRDEHWWSLARVLVQYPFRAPEAIATVFDRPQLVLARWDQLTRQRHVVALAGADAHANLTLRRGSEPVGRTLLELPSYEAAFRAFALRVELDAPLTHDPGRDAQQIVAAIERGHVFTAIDAFASPAIFSFRAASGSATAREGEDLPIQGPLRVDVVTNLPPGGQLLLLRNGRRVHQTAGATLTWKGPARPGAYRVEARLSNARGRTAMPWIFSNPIYVGGVPAPVDPSTLRPKPTGSRALCAAGRQWSVEHDRTSRVELADLVSGEGRFSLSFRLGRDGLSPYVAASCPDVADLGGFDRLSFRGRAERPMRLSVQLRGGAPTGGEVPRWARSVYLDQQPRQITVYFDDVHPVGPVATWRPDFARANAILFVVDTVNTAPGTQGQVSVEDVKLER